MEETKYKLYVYDTYGSVLRKLLHNEKTFKTLEDAKAFISPEGKAAKWVKQTAKKGQIVICEKTTHWRIVEVIDPA